MNAIVPFHHVNIATSGGRLDIRAMVRHYLAPFTAAKPFADIIETVRANSSAAIRRCRNRRPGAAIAINRAVANYATALEQAIDQLSIALLAPDEENIRGIVGAMMLAFPNATPTETAGYFVDALVLELKEPGSDDPFCLPAIAAAAREMWTTLPAPPSIAQFIVSVRKHQQRIEAVMHQLCDVLEAADWAEDMIERKRSE
jgi:hypothetical protein